MAHKPGLGRGLAALLPGDDDDSTIDLAEDRNEDTKAAGSKPLNHDAGSLRGAVVQLAVDRLVPNPDQPRKNFDLTELQELADSISRLGIIEPIIVADDGNGDTKGNGSYIIVAGERRTRAARLAGLTEVPAIVCDYSDQQRLEVSLIENIQRSDLNPIEEATAYKNLMDFSQLSQEELAVRVGKSRSAVTNALRLLKLTADMQKSVETGDISPGHARALLSVIDKKQREQLFKEITDKELSVREAEKRASALNVVSADTAATGEETPKTKTPSKQAPEIDAMEEKFIGRLGTKVIIEGDLNKGRIHIDYYSMEDLERLYEILGG
jgi:ParB family chromosome partitioning protein